MQSIIIFVLAIIVMSSLVVAVRTILNKVSPEQIEETVGSQQVPFKAASYDQPLTIGTSGNQLTLKTTDTKKVGFDFYNTGTEDITPGTKVEFSISACTDSSTPSITFGSYLIDKTIPPGETLDGGVVLVKSSGVQRGSYTCLVQATVGDLELTRTVIFTVK